MNPTHIVPQSDIARPSMVETAKRSLRQYISKASFSTNADRESALLCVDVLEAAAAPAAGEPITHGDVGLLWSQAGGWDLSSAGWAAIHRFARLVQPPACQKPAPSLARKVGGSYEADGWVVARFTTRAGAERVVFEFEAIPGMLHIFASEQVHGRLTPQQS